MLVVMGADVMVMRQGSTYGRVPLARYARFIEVPTDVSAEGVSTMCDALINALRGAGVA